MLLGVGWVAAGAATSILLAWGVAIAEYRGWLTDEGDLDIGFTNVEDYHVTTVVTKRIGSISCWQSVQNADPPYRLLEWVPPPRVRVPTWARPPRDSDVNRETIGFGFPLVCMKHFADYARPASSFPVVIQRPPVRLPYQPILLNLFWNSVIFAPLFASPWIFAALRRVRRRHCGSCPSCNYDLRGDFAKPCSECGRIIGAGERAAR